MDSHRLCGQFLQRDMYISFLNTGLTVLSPT